MSTPLTVRDLIRALLNHPMDSTVYVGKGMGALGAVNEIAGGTPDRVFYVVLSPVTETTDPPGTPDTEETR